MRPVLGMLLAAAIMLTACSGSSYFTRSGGEPEAVLALRDDVVKPSADKDELLANCAERTFFAPVVPKVVE